MSVTKLTDVGYRYIGLRHVTIASYNDSIVTNRLLYSWCNDSNLTDMQWSGAINDTTRTDKRTAIVAKWQAHLLKGRKIKLKNNIYIYIY